MTYDLLTTAGFLFAFMFIFFVFFGLAYFLPEPKPRWPHAVLGFFITWAGALAVARFIAPDPFDFMATGAVVPDIAAVSIVVLLALPRLWRIPPPGRDSAPDR